jgi:hypothetical protein
MQFLPEKPGEVLLAVVREQKDAFMFSDSKTIPEDGLHGESG